MADVKITQLPPCAVPDDEDLFAVTQDVSTVPVSRNITALQVKAYIGAPNPFDQDLNTTDDVIFNDVDAADITSSSLTDVTLAGAGLTPAAVDNSGRIIRGSTAKCIYMAVETSSSDNGYRVRSISQNGDFIFNFSIPDDFATLTKVSLIGWPKTAGAGGSGKNIDLMSNYGGVGENINAHSENNTMDTYDLGSEDVKFELDATSVFTDLSAGDTCALTVDQNSVGGSVAYIFVKLDYNIT